MGSLVIQWLHYLEGHQGLLGLLLLVGGLCLLLSGWRFARFSLLAIFGLIGAILGLQLGKTAFESGVFAAFCGSGLAVVSLLLRQLSGPVLAGAISAAALFGLLWRSPLPIPAACILLALIFIAVVALGVMSKRETTIVLTSFIGAAIFVSGLVAMVSESRGLAIHYRSMSGNVLFFPFLLLVPTVSGMLIQLAAARRSDAGDVKL